MDVRSTRGDFVRSQSISTSVSPWRISPSLAGRVAFHHGLLRLLIVVGLGSPVHAQIGAGALAGQVVDQAGAAVPGAAVTVTAVGTNLSRTTVTDREGGYVVTSLAPGAYRV